MFSLFGRSSRLCDSMARRELLTVGGLSLLGLGLPEFLGRRMQAKPAVADRRTGFGGADSVILVYLQGSPSHIDLWDPKPRAPAEIRGEFKPIATKAPGLFVGEVLPLLAEQADHYAVVRSIGVDPKGLRNHGAAIYMLMTGHDPRNFSPTGLAVPPSREDLPALGAVAARYQPAPVGNFGNVAVGAPVKEGRVIGVGQSAGLLGGAFDPYTMYDDCTKPLHLQGFELPTEMTLDRLQARVDLKSIIEMQSTATTKAAGAGVRIHSGSQAARRVGNVGFANSRTGDRPAAKENKFGHSRRRQDSAFDAYYEKALSLIQTNRAVHAFRLQDELATTRERYGLNQFGQSCLLARRLIEAETRFVQVNWPARSDDEPRPGPDGSWDTHRNNFPMLRDHRCPVFDRALSALIADMSDRGLLDKTLVVAIGEFGRSPKIGAPTTNNVGPGGRDHWPECYSFLIAGAGVRPGRSFGESDRHGAWPKSDAVHPYDLISTIYYALGIDPATEYHDSLNRPRRLVQSGRPIAGLF